MSVCIFFIPKPRAIASQSVVKCQHGTLKSLLHTALAPATDSAPFRFVSGIASKIVNLLLLTALAVLFTVAGSSPASAHSAPIPLNRPYMSENQLQPRRLDLFNADVQLISGCSQNTASRKIREAKDGLGKKEWQIVTIREYCDYFGYDYLEVLKLLKLL